MCNMNGESMDHLLLRLCLCAQSLVPSVLHVWSSVGHAMEGGGLAGLLERGLWWTPNHRYVGGYSCLYYVDYMAKKKHVNIRGD